MNPRNPEAQYMSVLDGKIVQVGDLNDIQPKGSYKLDKSFEKYVLMPGLVEVPDTKVIFDGPSGRIVEIIVIGNVELDKINTFYATALPQLGWVLLSNGDYNRGSEILRIDKIPNFTGSTKNGVHFVVHPARSD